MQILGLRFQSRELRPLPRNVPQQLKFFRGNMGKRIWLILNRPAVDQMTAPWLAERDPVGEVRKWSSVIGQLAAVS